MRLLLRLRQVKLCGSTRLRLHNTGLYSVNKHLWPNIVPFVLHLVWLCQPYIDKKKRGIQSYIIEFLHFQSSSMEY
jgi:hypothetical protein